MSERELKIAAVAFVLGIFIPIATVYAAQFAVYRQKVAENNAVGE